MPPKISIIVPVYKAENYLHRCVDSLLAQTFSDFEVLLIDDGSPDRSGEICDEYAKKDNRIRVFHKENGGVSSARQCGIDNAEGEYTIHADPDDWVEATMLEELYAKAKEEDADMVICDFYVNYGNKQIYKKQKPSSLDHETVLKEMFQQLHGSCWNKLIRRSCYKDNNISFDLELSFCEDLYFHIQLLSNPIKITYLNRSFYHYVRDVNPNSIVRIYDEKIYLQDVYLFNRLKDIAQRHSCYKQCVSNFSYNLVFRAFRGNIFSSKEFKQKFGIYANTLLKYRNVNILIRLLLFVSCKGFYGIAYNMIRMIKIK